MGWKAGKLPRASFLSTTAPAARKSRRRMALYGRWKMLCVPTRSQMMWVSPARGEAP